MGRSGTVRLDARFDAGYFVSVRVAGQDFRGMLYYPPACQARRPAGGHPRALSVSIHASTRAVRSAAWLRAGRPVHARACIRPLPSMPRRACSRAHEAVQERALLKQWHASRLRGVIHSAGWLPVLGPEPPASQPPAQRVLCACTSCLECDNLWRKGTQQWGRARSAQLAPPVASGAAPGASGARLAVRAALLSARLVWPWHGSICKGLPS